jgi:uncharacterized protein (TIGR03492 family)
MRQPKFRILSEKLRKTVKLLLLSNGHGEDEIAIRIIKRLQQSPNCPILAALPLVGFGHAYTRLGISLLDEGQKMPSGGFITMDIKQLWRDIRGGLLGLTSRQYRLVRDWGKEGGKILAVGDILPLALAWLSETDYAFVGTAKSEYYLRDQTGWLDSSSKIDRWWGSYYYPWERWLMSNPRCQGVFPRDSLTSKVLQHWSIPVVDAGNPMMDDLLPSITGDFPQDSLNILLLPGSRFPECLHNWQKILIAAAAVIARFPDYKLEFLAAISPSLDQKSFISPLIQQGWRETSINTFICPDVSLIISQSHYAEYLSRCHLAIAMAGTATEQFVGLGKPAITIAGSGPQFTPHFARLQQRLLGCSILLGDSAESVPEKLEYLLQNPQQWQKIASNGKIRMGASGASERIAQWLLSNFLNYPPD